MRGWGGPARGPPTLRTERPHVDPAVASLDGTRPHACALSRGCVVLFRFAALPLKTSQTPKGGVLVVGELLGWSFARTILGVWRI